MGLKPNRLMIYIIYTVVIALTGIIIWSYFQNIDKIKKVTFEISTEDTVEEIKSLNTSRVIKVNVHKGDIVKEGDVLLNLDSGTIPKDIESIEANLKTAREDYFNTRKLRNSIFGSLNLFEENNTNTQIYYNKYKNYEVSAQIKTNKKYAEKVKSMIEELSNDDILLKSISEGDNYFNEDQGKYADYIIYKDTLATHSQKIEKLEEELKVLEAEKVVLENEKAETKKIEEKNIKVEEKKAEVNAAKQEKTNYITNEDKKIKDRMEDNKKKINENIKTYGIEPQGKEATDAIKIQSYLEIDQNIKETEAMIKEYETKNNELLNSLQEFSLKASIKGTVEYETEINTGELVEAGKTLFKIIPESEKVANFIIRNEDRPFIKPGQNVKYVFNALDKNTYGFYKGKVLEVSDTSFSTDQEKGLYKGIGKIDFKSNKNTVEIKGGMIGEASIIIGKESLLDFFLKKIGLKNSK